MKRWDVFISHASEDKAEVAAPLADALRRGGVRVWLDKQELQIGDSLREKIDDGLADSRFGIVILSPNFFSKPWPRREINGLMALEEGGQKVILPVWHTVTKEQVAQYSPMLADRLSANTADGIRSVVRALLAVIFDPKHGSPSADRPTLTRRLVEVLDRSADVLEVWNFLDANPSILGNMGAMWSQNVVVARPRLFGLEADFAVGSPAYSIAQYRWRFFILSPLFADALFTENAPVIALANRINQIESLLKASAKEPVLANSKLLSDSEIICGKPLPFTNPGYYEGTIFAGRRDTLAAEDQENLRKYNQTPWGIPFLSTYDRLIEFAEAVGQSV
jgi:hypothetical protein